MEEEEKLDMGFTIPYYVMEEIIEYVELTALGKSKSCKWSNILSLMRMAMINKNMTKRQYEFMKEKYNREA